MPGRCRGRGVAATARELVVVRACVACARAARALCYLLAVRCLQSSNRTAFVRTKHNKQPASPLRNVAVTSMGSRGLLHRNRADDRVTLVVDQPLRPIRAEGTLAALGAGAPCRAHGWCGAMPLGRLSDGRAARSGWRRHVLRLTADATRQRRALGGWPVAGRHRPHLKQRWRRAPGNGVAAALAQKRARTQERANTH